MEDLSLHILDIAENSVVAGANKVEIRIEERTEDDLFIVEMRDNGRGMDDETLKMVADPFFTTKTVRRFGLGIPLLKQAAEECGGNFSISSDKDRGTVISAAFKKSHIDMIPLGDIGATIITLIAGNHEIDFILEYNSNGYHYCFDTTALRMELGDVPLCSPRVLQAIKEEINTAIKRSDAQTRRQLMSGERILIIDDEEIVRISCKKCLVPEGYQVDFAMNGVEGLSLAKANKYDLILTDLKMPDMDGMEFLDKIKDVQPGTKVIMITGYSTVEHAVKAIKLGAHNYIEKPFTPDTLLTSIKEALSDKVKGS